VPIIFHWGKDEGPKAETGVGFFGQQPPHHQLEGLESAVSSSSGVLGGAPTAERFSVMFITQDGLS